VAVGNYPTPSGISGIERNDMTWDQIAGPLRAILPPLLAFVVAKGWIPAGSADWIVSSVVALGAAVWSIWSNRPAAIAASAQLLPGVNVQTTPAAGQAVQTAVANAKAA
jgi:hypothetical protein